MVQAQMPSIGALSTMLKDVDTVAGAAQAAGLPMPLTGTVQQVLRIASAMGLGPAELSAVVGVLQPERRDEFMVQVTR
jgi:2-hydroxy-3-oxopropionate reductase